MQDAFERYKESPDDYNHNNSNYANEVNAKGQFLVEHSPEIRQYMRDRNIKAGGGSLSSYPTWNDLSMRERAAYIGAAVRNGFT